MMSASSLRRAIACAALSLCVAPSQSHGAELSENCVVNVLNRTVQVSAQGGWSMPNVPSNMGRVRARATCTQGNQTISGQSDYFNVVQNGVSAVGKIKFEAVDPVPVSIAFTDDSIATLSAVGATFQLAVRATYPDGTISDVTASSNGTNYSSTNPAIATVSAEGLVTARSSGSVLITARKDEVVALRPIVVNAGGDSDGDGLPDDFEQANGLNPNDPIDAQEDEDGDGLTAQREFHLGTQLRNPDSDADGLTDGEEAEPGTDGFVTNPLNPDTDGDGLRDRVEVLAGSSPTDPNDRNLAAALDRITVNPSSIVLTFNTVNTEVSSQLTVTGVLIDGSTINLTPKSTGTTYVSGNLDVVSFGLTDGEIFGGQSGDATVTVANSGKQFVVAVRVETFQPQVLAAIDIPGHANNVDVAGDYAFVAAGAAGLQIVDVSDRRNPAIAASLDTDGTAVDVRVFGNFAYVADGSSGLKIINVINPLTPTLAASIDTAGFAQDVKVDSEYAYIADGTNGVEVIDVRDPAHPIARGHIGSLGEARGIDVQGNRAVVVAGVSLYILDVADRAAPSLIGSISLGQVKDVVLEGNYAYVAAYSSGYRVVDISTPSVPLTTGGDASFYPFDLELVDGLAFFAEVLFPNAVPYVNVTDPQQPVFQGTIDFIQFGDLNGTGIALDGSYIYITQSTGIVDYQATGTTRLHIGQYRLLSDNSGNAPTVSINKPLATDAIVEGTTVTVDADAADDVGVRSVTFSVDGTVVFTDTSRPFQVPVAIPFGKTSLTIVATAVDFGGNSASAQVTVPVLADTDRDGLSDERETTVHQTNPNDADTDDDGLSDGQEIALGTNPRAADSDGDGHDDQQELNAGTDPLNPDAAPPTVVATVPADNATNVPENGAVTVTFNEPIQPKSVTSDTVKLLLNGNPVPGTVRLMPNGVDVTFTPAGLLNKFTLHTVLVAGAKDLAGNPMVSFQSRFTTGNFVDGIAPQIVQSNPASNMTGVPTNAIVTLFMSEAVDPLSVTDNTFFVTDSQGNRIAGQGTLSQDARTLVFVPNAALAVRRQHTIRVSVRDLFGNANNTQLSFTTDFAADGQAPRVLATSLADGQTAVPTNVALAVRFNEAINRITLGGITLKQGTTALSVQRELSVEGGGTVVRLVPTVPLAGNTSYELSAAGVEDLSGNVLALPVTASFTTGATADNTAPPTVVWRTPLNNATSVPRNALIEAQVSKRINPVSLHVDSFRIVNSQTGISVPGTLSLSPDGTTIRFVPSASLAANATHTFHLGFINQLEDIVGNRFGSFASFTTGSASDTVAPVIQLQSIADGASGMPVNSRVVLQFDAPLAERCVNAQTVRMTTGGATVTGIITLSSDRRTIAFAPQAALATDTAYTLNLQGVCDLAGNTLASFTTGFTTSAVATADTTRPTVTITPVQSATNVPTTTPITMEFSEPIDVTTLAGGVQVSVSGVTGEVAGTLSVVGTTATFTPLQPLPGNKTINISVANVTDMAGNPVIGAGHAFTTGAPGDATAPQVVSVVPNDGLVDVQPGASIVLTFSESLDPSTLNSANFVLFVNGAIVSPTVSRSQDNRTVMLTASLPASSVISVIATSGVRDLSGNALTDFVSAFTTAAATDVTRPSVVAQFPGNGASNVLPDASVTLYTSEAMMLATLQPALHIAQNGVIVQGTITPVGNGQAVTFRPNQPWTPNALIEVYLDSNALDVQGNALTAFQSNFRIAQDPVTSRPIAVSFSPQTVVGGMPINAPVDTLFSEPLDPATVVSANVVLRDLSNSQVIPSTISLIAGGQVIRVQPQAPLLVSHGYGVQLSAGLRDLQGQTQVTPASFTFTTNAVAVPDTVSPKVLAMSPPSGSTSVSVSAHVHARFDESMNTLSLNRTPQQTAFGSIFWSDQNRDLRFVRHQPYAASSQITESVAGIEDPAGNGVAGPASTTFTTGTGADFTDPVIVDVTPFHDATQVPVNAGIRVTFNEQIDPVTVNNVTLLDSQAGTRASTVTLEPDGRTITIVPTGALLVGRTYTLNLPVRDPSGNDNNVTRRFVTSFVADTSAPVNTTTSVVDGQTGVPTNAVLQVAFDEAINMMTVSGVVLRHNGVAVPSTLVPSGDRRVLTFRLVQPLLANAGYTITIDGVEDLSGNALELERTVSFTTGSGVDLELPAIVARTPFANATGVPRNPQIEVQFSKPVNPVSVSSTAQRLNDTTTGLFIEGTRTLSADRRTLTFVPAQTLVPYRAYTFNVSQTAFTEDLAGNRVSGNWTFTTGGATDSTAPQVLQQSIADGAAAVPVNARVVLRFDAALGDSCLNGQTIQVSANGAPIAGTLTLSSDRTQATFTSQAPMATSTTHTLQVQGLCDLAGNALNNFTTTFTTSADATPDNTRPTVSLAPAPGTTIPVATPFVMTFSEAIDVTSLASGIQVTASGVTGEIAGDLAVSGNVVTFTPLNPLPGNKAITVTVSAVNDLAGNQVIGVAASYTTGAAADVSVPTVVSISPRDGTVDVVPNSPVVITFSESLDASTLNNNNLVFFVNGAVTRPTVARSQDNRSIILTSGLPVASVVSVIASSDVRDLSGNRLTEFVSAFTTAAAGDTTRPRVVSQFPGSGASSVLPAVDIFLYTSEPIDADSLEDALHVSQNGAVVNGTFTLSGGDQIVRFHPAQPWVPNSLIEVFIDDKARDLAGNLFQPHSGSFRVLADTFTAAPTVVASAASSVNVGQPINPAIDVLFSEPLNASTVTTGNITLRQDFSGGPVVPISVSLIKFGLVVRVTPTTNLLTGRQYILTFGTGLRDTQGVALASAQSLTVSTGLVNVPDTAGPRVLAVGPPNGATGVAVNGHTHWRFDEPINPFSIIGFSTLGPGAVFWADDNRDLRVQWHTPLTPNTQITESIAVAQDFAGNAVVPPFTTSYTTGSSTSPDVTPPSVVFNTPFDRAGNVPVNAVVRAVFDEQIDPASVTPTSIYLWHAQAGRIVAGTSTLEPDGRTVTVVPDAPLGTFTEYHFWKNGPRDMAGNSVAVATGFITGPDTDTQAPLLLTTTVADGQTGVPTNAVLQIQFNEPISALELEGVTLRQGGQPVPGSLAFSGDRTTITLRTVQPLLPGTAYVITVAGVEDLSGNRLAVDRTIGFTTGAGIDLVPLTIVLKAPGDFAGGVPRNVQPEVTFNKRLNPASVKSDSIWIRDTINGNTVAGTVALLPDGMTLRFTPSSLLLANRQYFFQVAASTPLEDLAGNRFDSTVWIFVTGAQ